MTDATSAAPARHAGGRPLLVTLLLASMLTTMAGAIVAPALPAMEKHFAGAAHVGLLVRMVLTVPGLAIAFGAPVVGVLIDRTGRKPILVASVALFAVAGSSGLYLGNLYAVLVGRLLLGVAVAGIMTATTTLVADHYPGQQRSRILGLQAGFMGFGGVAFLSLGGVLADLSWRGPFAIYLVALPLTILTLWLIREPHATDGAAAEAEAADTAGGFPKLAFGIYALVFASQLVFYTIPSQLPFYLDDLANVGAGGSGLAIALMSLSTALVGLSFGRIGKNRSHRTIAIATFVLLTVGYAAIGAATGVPLVLAGLLVAGAGIGLLIPNLNTWLVSRTPVAMRGRVLSGVTSTLFLGQFVSPLVSQPVSGAVGLDGVYLAASGLAAVLALLILFTVRGGAALPAPRQEPVRDPAEVPADV
ncbi:MFS transporter [Kitasatospora sp. NPDC056531]|uniref:MFS transporter n=1 Tax=Kitasatospora sp. NPDC056531 TaxID=3345856 RepID=UPI0036B9813C